MERGIVTSAAFADVDGDGWPDLVVAGEWMGVKIFRNHRGVFREDEIAGSTGLWQTVAIADVNGDGYPDILAGNWGHNSKLSAGKDGPLKLYVKDFEHSGTVQQLMTYGIGGVEYPFMGKDQLELALPLLKHSRLRYDEVAGKSVQGLFGTMLDSSRVYKAEMLGSACFLNDGKGNFSPASLPWELQLAPVFGFLELGGGSWMAVGNFYGVQPFEGKYDALNPTVFSYDKGLRYSCELAGLSGEFRDAKWVRGAHGRLLVLARNNGEPVFLREGVKHPPADSSKD